MRKARSMCTQVATEYEDTAFGQVQGGGRAA